jgi:hypothetical protein
MQSEKQAAQATGLEAALAVLREREANGTLGACGSSFEEERAPAEWAQQLERRTREAIFSYETRGEP